MPPQFYGKQPPPPPQPQTQPQPQGGTYEQDQMNLQNMYADAGRAGARDMFSGGPSWMSDIQEIKGLKWQHTMDRLRDKYKKKTTQPKEPQIDITQEDGFGGIWNQPKPPAPPPPPPQPRQPKWISGHRYVKDPSSVLPPSRGGTGPPLGTAQQMRLPLGQPLGQRSGTQYRKGVGRRPQQSGGISGQQQGIGQPQQTPTQGGPRGY